MKNLIWLFLIFGASIFNLEAEDAFSIKSEISLSKDGTNEFKFDLEAIKDVDIYTSEFPWSVPMSFTCVVVTAGSNTPIKQIALNSSPMGEKLHLKVGDKISGSMPVDLLFPEIQRENKIGPLVFFWQWTPRFLRGEDFEEKLGSYGGWIKLPENSLEKRRKP